MRGAGLVVKPHRIETNIYSHLIGFFGFVFFFFPKILLASTEKCSAAYCKYQLLFQKSFRPYRGTV